MPSDLSRRTRLVCHAILLGLIAAMPSWAHAGIVIDVGEHALLPGTANQQVDILVSAEPTDSLISGSNIRAEIGDGLGALPEPTFQGPATATPPLNGATILSTIFDVPGGVISGQSPAAGAEQFSNLGTTTPTNVSANGTLISFFIDTTAAGAPGDVFPLRLGSFVTAGLPGDTEFLGPVGDANPISITINNGTLAIASPNTLAGDYNQDGIVDAADYTVWRDSLGTTASSLGSGADGDGNGLIEINDYNIWRDNFGLIISASDSIRSVGFAVPEPGAASLLLAVLTFRAVSRESSTTKRCVTRFCQLY